MSALSGANTPWPKTDNVPFVLQRWLEKKKAHEQNQEQINKKYWWSKVILGLNKDVNLSLFFKDVKTSTKKKKKT